MIVDVLCAGLVLLAAIVGFNGGVARQLTKLGGAIGGWTIALPLAPSLGTSVARAAALPKDVGVAAVALFLVFAGWVVAIIVFRRVTQDAGDPRRETADQVGGLLIGGLQIAALLFALFSGVTVVQASLLTMDRKLPLDLRASLVASMAQEHNLFAVLGVRATALASPTSARDGGTR
jgi:uncharacterized membrane protein required for colicin V production